VRRKEIVKIDNVTRTIIEEYSGINMAAKILKVDENTIRKYIRNKQILTGNFILEFKKDLTI